VTVPPEAPEPTPQALAALGSEHLPLDRTADDQRVPGWLKRAVVWTIVVLVATRVALWAFSSLTTFWFTLAFAFFFALSMEPLVDRLAARGMRRGLATFLVMGAILLGTAAFFAVFGQLLFTQLAELVKSVPTLIEDIVEWVNRTFDTDLDYRSLLDSLNISPAQIANIAGDLGLGVLGLITTAVGLIFNIFTMLLFAFYLAADGHRLRRTVASWLPPSRQRVFLRVWEISSEKAGGYVISRGVLAVISATAHSIFFAIVGVPYWLPLGLWVGLVSQFIPTIGTYLAGALPIIIALVGGDLVAAALILGFVLVYQQVENYFLAPRITQTTLQVHSAVAFGSVVVGGALFGAVGALLAIPVVAIILAVMDTYARPYELVEELGPRDTPTAGAALTDDAQP
jgi:predicted PurR-regulated permease PerM